MTHEDRLLVTLHCSSILESAKRIAELVAEDRQLKAEVDVHLSELMKPVVWNGCGNE